MYYKWNKVNLNRGGSYVDSPYCIKSKKVTIYLINKKDSKFFQCAVTVALYYEETEKYAERKTKIKPFINKYKWEGINYPSAKNDWKKYEKNKVTIVVKILYAKKEKIHLAYVSKIHLNREKQVILLMIPSGEKRKAKSKGCLTNSEGRR